MAYLTDNNELFDLVNEQLCKIFKISLWGILYVLFDQGRIVMFFRLRKCRTNITCGIDLSKHRNTAMQQLMPKLLKMNMGSFLFALMMFDTIRVRESKSYECAYLVLCEWHNAKMSINEFCEPHACRLYFCNTQSSYEIV